MVFGFIGGQILYIWGAHYLGGLSYGTVGALGWHLTPVKPGALLHVGQLPLKFYLIAV